MGTLRLTQGGLFASGHFELGLFFPPCSLFGASQGEARHVQVSLKDAVFLLLSEITACLDPWLCSRAAGKVRAGTTQLHANPTFSQVKALNLCPPNQHLPSLAGSCLSKPSHPGKIQTNSSVPYGPSAVIARWC